MSDRIFLDTNILVYLYSTDEPLKRQHIEFLLTKIDLHDVFISTQVINEFINVLHKKRKVPIPTLIKTIEDLLQLFNVIHVTESTIKNALKIVNNYHFSYFDSLMLASALEADCIYIFSEDMHDQQIIEKSLAIINPFKTKS